MKMALHFLVHEQAIEQTSEVVAVALAQVEGLTGFEVINSGSAWRALMGAS